jgi:two-component system, OmpR family, KDP operon response regulator KdpE
MTRILAVDDEPQILRALATNLRARGYDVDLAETGETALTIAATKHPDLVILDLGLPGIDGVEVIRGLRGWTRVPIIVLSVREAERHKVAALDAGADDYVTKPFGIEELLARLRAALRRALPRGEPTIEVGDLRIDLDKHSVSRAGEPIRLTPHEFGMLSLFARNQGKLLTHRTILREVWGPAYQVESHYLHVYVSQLRRKLERDSTRPRYILTEPGAGYRFVDPGTP